MDNVQISSKTIFEDVDNLVFWTHLYGNTTGLSDQAKAFFQSRINQEIMAIWDAQVPTADEKLLMANPRPSPKMRVFVEEGNHLSKIVWLAWEPRKND